MVSGYFLVGIMSCRDNGYVGKTSVGKLASGIVYVGNLGVGNLSDIEKFYININTSILIS